MVGRRRNNTHALTAQIDWLACWLVGLLASSGYWIDDNGAEWRSSAQKGLVVVC